MPLYLTMHLNNCWQESLSGSTRTQHFHMCEYFFHNWMRVLPFPYSSKILYCYDWWNMLMGDKLSSYWKPDHDEVVHETMPKSKQILWSRDSTGWMLLCMEICSLRNKCYSQLPLAGWGCNPGGPCQSTMRQYCRVPARRGLKRTARAATRHGARDPLVRPQVDQTYQK